MTLATATLQKAVPKRSGTPILESVAYAIGPHILILMIWEGVRVSTHAPSRLMPSIGSMVGAVVRGIHNGILPDYLYESLYRLGLAGVVSIVVGIVIGLAIGIVPGLAAYATPVLRYFSSLSGIVWLPLFLLWFGFNERTVLATISYTFVFPVIFNTITGVRTVPKVYRNVIYTLGGSWWRVITDVVLPGALPSIIAGVRLGFGYGWRAVIASEMLLGMGGLGYMIFKAQSVNLTDRLLAGMVIIGLLWSVMDYLILQPLEEGTIRRWGLTHR